MSIQTNTATGEKPTGPAELAGTLQDFTLEEVFELFTATRATGVLTFGEPVGATLWITDGAISYGTSPGTPGPRELLVRQGIVTADQFDAAAALGDAPLSASLASNAGVDPDRIEALAREQIVTTAFEIVAVGADGFEFRSGGADPLGAAITMGHLDVLTEAEHRRDEWRRIAELVPSTGIVPVLSAHLPGGQPSVTIPASTWPVLAQIDGRRSAADVIAQLGLSAYEVCGILFDLLDDGTIRILDPDETDDKDLSDL